MIILYYFLEQVVPHFQFFCELNFKIWYHPVISTFCKSFPFILSTSFHDYILVDGEFGSKVSWTVLPNIDKKDKILRFLNHSWKFCEE